LAIKRCEPTRNSGRAVTGITHANRLASLVGSTWIWICASTKPSSKRNRMFSPVWSTGMVVGPGGPESPKVPPQAWAAAGATRAAAENANVAASQGRITGTSHAERGSARMRITDRRA
jgi:hypothetical protein